MSETKVKHVVSNAGKNLLKRSILSTQAQNRRLEERLAWEAHSKMKAHSVDPRAEGERKHTQQHRSTSLDRSNKYDDRSNKIRKISHKESSPPDRWSHSKYKELYPEEFTGSSSDDESLLKSKLRKKKKTKKSKKKKSEKKKKHKHSKKSSKHTKK